MTESEAKQRWCPMARVVMTPQDPTWQNQALTNRGTFDTGNGIMCIASDCMIWREADRIEDPRKFGNFIPTGYCGLANKP